MNAEDRKQFGDLNGKVDQALDGIQSLTQHLLGNGSGVGVFDRIGRIEDHIATDKIERVERQRETDAKRTVTRRWYAGTAVAVIGLVIAVAAL